MMRVAICSDGVFPDSVGGMQRHTRMLVESLSRRHPDLDIAVLHTHAGKRLFAAFPNVEEFGIAPRPNARQYLLECHDLSGRMAEVLRTMPDAVIYSQGLTVWKGITAFTPRLIVNPHGLESFQAVGWKDRLIAVPFRQVFKRIFRHARFVVSLGGRLTDILRRHVPDPAQRLVVLPNGVVPPAEELPDRPHESPPLRALFVGRFAANKGIPYLLSAVDMLNEQGLGHRFVVRLVGTGPLYEPLKSASERPNVAFCGGVDDARLDRLYADSDVFVLPTLFEGMPTVVLEAMARKLPVIVTDVGATRELVDEANGFIIRKRNARDIAVRLRELADMPASRRAALGQAAWRKVQDRFTWNRVADAHYEVIAKLAAEIASSR
jgi:glycosyltransferase involved in cell wall biosynthesis